MKNAVIQCDLCHVEFVIENPTCFNGIPQPGTKVSTEVGCPQCLHPDGTFLFFVIHPEGTTVKYLGTTPDGVRFTVTPSN